jgi:hypothetical protein
MSHFTEIKTQIKDLGILKDALLKGGLAFETADEGVDVFNFFGDKERCALSIGTGTKYAVGVKLTADGTYELSADWELLGQCKVDVEDLRSRILQNYSYCLVKSKLEAEGYSFGEESVDESGHVQMTVTKW